LVRIFAIGQFSRLTKAGPKKREGGREGGREGIAYLGRGSTVLVRSQQLLYQFLGRGRYPVPHRVAEGDVLLLLLDDALAYQVVVGVVEGIERVVAWTEEGRKEGREGGRDGG